MSIPNSSTPLISAGRLFPGPNLLWKSGAVLATVGMATGAFGSHGLKKRPGVTPDNINAFQTAAHYMIFNGLALLLVSLHPKHSLNRFAGPAIGLGGLIFSSSIFALVLNRDKFKFLGPITPIGGTFMIAGYLALAF